MPSQVSSHLRATVATNLDHAIAARGLTNREVGEIIGTTEHQVWRWRKGRVKPNDDTLAALAAALERDIAWFYVEHQVATP